MMRLMNKVAAALVAVTMTAGLAVAQDAAPATDAQEIVLAQAKSKARSGPRHTGTHVYLLRGFMDIFSTGMDDLGSKLSRQGIRATVHNHSEFQSLAAGIIGRHQKGIRENVVIVGHSLGGNDAFRMAEQLGAAKINVPLIIAFDPTASMSVPANVSRVVNFYSSTNGWGAPIQRGPGFRGSLSNVDLSRRGEMGHTDIDKSPALHNQSIGYIRSIGAPRAPAATAASSKGDQSSAKAAASKSAEAKESASETKAADAKKDDVSEAKTAEKPAAESKAADTKPAENKLAETPKAAEAKDSSPGSTASVPEKKTETAASSTEESKSN